MTACLLRCVVALAFWLPGLRAGNDDIQLVGVMHKTTSMWAALRPASSGVATWVKIGDRYGPWTVDRSDAGRDVVVLEGPRGRVELRLRESHLAPSTSAATSYPDERNRGIQLAARAAYQFFHDQAADRTAGADLERRDGAGTEIAEFASFRFYLRSDGGLVMKDRGGDESRLPEGIPVHITVPAGATLEQVAQRLHMSVQRLAQLNPSYVTAPGAAVRHTVQVR